MLAFLRKRFDFCGQFEDATTICTAVGQHNLCQRLKCLGRGHQNLRCWNSLNALQATRDSLGLDHPPEGIVRHEVIVVDDGLVGDGGHRANMVPGLEPRLDATTIIGDAGAEGDGVLHEVEGDGVVEGVGHRKVRHLGVVGRHSGRGA